MSHFVKAPEDYNRQLNIVNTYHHDAALYLQLETGQSYDECLEFTRNKSTELGDDPEIMFLQR